VRRQLAAIVRTRKILGAFQQVEAKHTAQTEAYVCSECGFFEEYVKAPAEVPWDDVDGATRLDRS